MTYIFKNLTKNKIKALFYIISSNQDFKEHIKPEEFTEDDGLFRGIQAMDSDLDWHKFLEYAKLFADEVR